MELENCKYTAKFPFAQPNDNFVGPNTPPVNDFGLNITSRSLKTFLFYNADFL